MTRAQAKGTTPASAPAAAAIPPAAVSPAQIRGEQGGLCLLSNAVKKMST